MAAAGGKNGDLYSVLGLKKECSDAELRNAYKKLALRWHPDRCSATGKSEFVKEAKEKFQAIQEAYSILSDSNKRFLYDVGVCDSHDDENGMGDFVDQMVQMMRQTKPNENGQESFEDQQNLFMDMFEDDIDLSAFFCGRVPATNPFAASSSNRYCNAETVDCSGGGKHRGSFLKRFVYDVGVCDSNDDENGMGDFEDEMVQMMRQTKPNENGQESFEDNQKLFMDMFEDDIDISRFICGQVPATNPFAASSSNSYCNAETVDCSGGGKHRGSVLKRFVYDVRVCDSNDDENGMGDFEDEMVQMMRQTKPNENGQESFEDNQKQFMDMFEDDIDISRFICGQVPATNPFAASSSNSYCNAETVDCSGGGKRRGSVLISAAGKRKLLEFDGGSAGFCFGSNEATPSSVGRGNNRRNGKKQKTSSKHDISSNDTENSA